MMGLVGSFLSAVVDILSGPDFCPALIRNLIKFFICCAVYFKVLFCVGRFICFVIDGG